MALDLKGRQKEEFRDALINAFPSGPDLEELIYFEFEVPLTAITPPAKLDVLGLEIMKWAVNEEGRLDRLLAAALRKRGGNTALKRFALEVSATSDKPPAKGLESLVLAMVQFANAAQWRAKMASAERTICRIENPDGVGGWMGLGTGSLVGPDLVLTNAHVANRCSAGSRAQFDYAVDDAGNETTGPASAFAADWRLASSPSGELDYSLVRIADGFGEQMIGATKRGWLVPKPHDHAVGEPLFILQHPNAERLKVSAGIVSAVQPGRVSYTANTLPGSSGSPCFTMAWEMVALHFQGKTDANTGTRMNKILEHLTTTGKRGLLVE